MTSERLNQISERVSSMSLRERVFVFAAAAVVGLALVQTVLIDAVLQRNQIALERQKMADSALVQIEQQRQLLARPVGHDPDRGVRDALAAQESRLAELNAELEMRTRSLVPPERMHQVLKDVVRGQGGVRIVGFKTLSPQPVSPARGKPVVAPPLHGDPSASLTGAAEGALKDSDPLRPKGRVESYAPPGFYRHGFEVTVSGGYSELVAYLERLEALPWNLSWIEATLDAAARPDLTLTLTIHTLSLEEAWLRV